MSNQIKSLTGVRGMAAAAVIIYHVQAQHDAPWFRDAHGILWDFLLNGYLAVDLFFVLSGFVMALSYGSFARKGWTKKNYGVFLLRRIARVYPLYAFITCVITVPILLGVSKATPVNGIILVENLALVQSWGFNESIDPFAWSISVEFAAYLLFPLLTLLTLRGSWSRMIAVSFAAAAAICALQFTPTPPSVDARDGPLDIFWMPSRMPLLRCLCEFTLGLATYRLSENDMVRRWMGHSVAAVLFTLFLLVALLLPDADVLVVLCLPPVLLVLATGDNFASRAMSSRAIFFLGEISYALYLVHGPLLRVRRILDARLAQHMNSAGADAIALMAFYGSTLLLGWMAYLVIEKPCRKWIRGMEERLIYRSGHGNRQALA
jgi:peptidoglycan/LPS O-acetylase OafA/YrhL